MTKDWVTEQAACMDYDVLFERLKANVQRDVASANEVVSPRFKLERHTQSRFAVVEMSHGRHTDWTLFENKGDEIVVGGEGSLSTSRTRFSINLLWNGEEERCDIVITEKDSEEKDRFPAEDVWKVARKALQWMFFPGLYAR